MLERLLSTDTTMKHMDKTCYFDLPCGSLSDWLSGTATAAAFIFAIVQLWLQVRRQKRAEETEQAQKVSAWFDFSTNSIHIRNDSGAVVYDVFSEVVFSGEETMDQRYNSDYSRLLPYVPPSKTVALPVPTGWGGMHKTPFVRVAFRDQHGYSWYRSNVGRLYPVPGTVYKYFKMTAPYSYYRDSMRIF